MTEMPGLDLPTIDLVRRSTDQLVVDALLTEPQLTRAELAGRTGISKPTVSESVRRLAGAGLLVEAGAQRGGRGRSGTYVRLDTELGVVLAAAVGPDGVVAEVLDPRGATLNRSVGPVPHPVTADRLGPVLVDTMGRALGDRRLLAAAVSLAGPVDQRTGQLVELPDSPFLLGKFDAGILLADRFGGDLRIDNDVNWAALAEYRIGAAADLDHLAYVYLGPGLGAAVVDRGVVVHGAYGLAGEIAQVLTVGPRGRAMRLVECFAALNLHRPGTAAIDLARLDTVLTATDPEQREVADAVVTAVAGAIGSLTALLNPAGVVLGGPWAQVGDAAGRIADRVHGAASVDTTIRAAALGADAPLAGARWYAVERARAVLRRRVP